MLGDLMKEMQAVMLGIEDFPERVVIAPGSEIAFDCEQAWVRIEDATPKYRAGSACPEYTTFQFRVGFLRNVCTIDDRGNVPTPEQITLDGLMTIDDAENLLRAFRCWEPTTPGVLAYNLGLHWPLGPEGGLSGGEWEVHFKIAI